MVAIVIPACDIRDNNRLDLYNLLKDIEPLAKSTELLDEVIVCFDSCSWEFVNTFMEKFPWIHSIWNQGKAFQFTKNANQGLRYCFEKGFSAWLVNQDCRIPDMYSLLSAENGGLLSTVASKDPQTSPGLLVYTDIERCAFFCVRINYSLMEKVGFLDESYIKVFQDDDFCLRAHLVDMPVQSVNVQIEHKGSFIDSSSADWESASGCYNQEDLNIGLGQMQSKWDCNGIEHSAIIKTVLSKFKWRDEFKCL